IVNEIFGTRVDNLMRLVWPEDERVSRHNFVPAIFVTNGAASRNHQIQFPLCRVRVVRKIGFSRWHPVPFEVKRMPLREVERSRLASQRFRNSFEGDSEFTTRRLPRLLFDFVEIYLAHRLSFRGKSRDVRSIL